MCVCVYIRTGESPDPSLTSGDLLTTGITVWTGCSVMQVSCQCLGSTGRPFGPQHSGTHPSALCPLPSPLSPLPSPLSPLPSPLFPLPSPWSNSGRFLSHSNLTYQLNTGGDLLPVTDSQTTDGLQQIFATNLFGHFVLVCRALISGTAIG